MKHLLLSLLLTVPALAPAQTAYPRHHRTTHHATPRAVAQPTIAAQVYVCGGGSAYAYHRTDACAGLNRCSHGVSPVTVAEAEQMGRRPCKRCY